MMNPKTTYMKIGLGLAGVVVNDVTAEIIWRIYEDAHFKKGDFSVRDAVRIKGEVVESYKRKGKLKKKRVERILNDEIEAENIPKYVEQVSFSAFAD